jgi:hypothetical protein
MALGPSKMRLDAYDCSPVSISRSVSTFRSPELHHNNLAQPESEESFLLVMKTMPAMLGDSRPTLLGGDADGKPG